MNLVTSLLTQIAGGSAAIALDNAKPDWTYRVGASAPSASNPQGSPGVAITPGAMAAVGTALALALIPGKSGWQEVAANLAGGAIVAEGTMLASTTIVPAIKGALGQGGPVANPLMYGGVYGVPRGLPAQHAQVGVTDFELQRALANYRG